MNSIGNESCLMCENEFDPTNGDNWDGLCPGCADRVSEFMDDYGVSDENRDVAIQAMNDLEDGTAFVETARLQAENVWNEYRWFLRKDWQKDVADGSTNLGYWDWVDHKIEAYE